MTTITRIAAPALPIESIPNPPAPDPYDRGSHHDELTWWEDKLVEVILPDGHRCRGWVRHVNATPNVAPSDPGVMPGVLGWMTVTLFHERPDSRDGAPYPDEITTPIHFGGRHGRARAVRTLTSDEVWSGRLQSATPDPVVVARPSGPTVSKRARRHLGPPRRRAATG